MFAGRVITSRIQDATKKINTTFVLFQSKNKTDTKLKIGNELFNITIADKYSFNAKDSKGRFCRINFLNKDPRYSNEDNEILVDYGAVEGRYRYYFKP